MKRQLKAHSRWLTLFALLALCFRMEAADLFGRVVGVHDGDTITVLVVKTEHKVRLWGIDAPELKQAFGTTSKTALSDLVFGKDVRVELRGQDRYGRDLGIVFLGNRNENLALVKTGWAWWFEKYSPDADDLRKAQTAAMKKRVGLWIEKAPIPPWEFRKTPRSDSKT